ncbi:MAG: helix-turn-helix domain-containing protein [Methylomarinum sp.]|nr:helix-turn-helix domain-containing protein [Methylomarinum sp.]
MKINKESVALAKVIGQRMNEARQLCGYTLTESAQMMGISRELLHKYEANFDIAFIPALIVAKAAKSFDVTAEYLYGFVDDWEYDPAVLQERQMGVQSHEFYIKQLAVLATRTANQQKQIDTLNESAKALIGAITEMDDALSSFQQMNSSFEDLKVGSQLVYRMKTANDTASNATRKMIRNQLLPKTALSEA